MKVLIFDNDASSVLAMANYFSTRGYELEVASELVHAKSLLSSRPFDVVITDLRLSNNQVTGGLQLLRYIHEIAGRTRVIVVTACDSSDVRREAAGLGAEEYFIKPVSLQTIADALEHGRGGA